MNNNQVIAEIIAPMLSRNINAQYNLDYIHNSPAPENNLQALQQLYEAGQDLNALSVKIKAVSEGLHAMRILKHY